MRKICKIMCRYTPRASFCDTTKLQEALWIKARKTAVFRFFSAALRSKFIASEIGKQEVNLLIILYLFCTHHFAV